MRAMIPMPSMSVMAGSMKQMPMWNLRGTRTRIRGTSPSMWAGPWRAQPYPACHERRAWAPRPSHCAPQSPLYQVTNDNRVENLLLEEKLRSGGPIVKHREGCPPSGGILGYPRARSCHCPPSAGVRILNELRPRVRTRSRALSAPVLVALLCFSQASLSSMSTILSSFFGPLMAAKKRERDGRAHTLPHTEACAAPQPSGMEPEEMLLSREASIDSSCDSFAPKRVRRTGSRRSLASPCHSQVGHAPACGGRAAVIWQSGGAPDGGMCS